MRLIAAFVDNPVKVTVGVLLVALFGVVGLFQMPLQLTPEVQTPTINIRTRWPGSTPQEVERKIVHEQEEQLKDVEGMLKLSSESSANEGRITMEFAVGTDMSEAVVRVLSRLQQVREYPEDADEPVLTVASNSEQAIAWFMLGPQVAEGDRIMAFYRELGESNPDLEQMLARAARAKNPGLRLYRLRRTVEKYPQVRPLLPPEMDIARLRKFARDEIAKEFKRVPGVADSEVNGGQEEEMQILVDPQKLAARQLTIRDIRTALQEHNVDVAGGDVWETKRRWVVRTLGQFRSPEQVANVILARRDGAPVYIRDVAEVRLGYKKPDGVVRRFGEVRIAINASRAVGANVKSVMAGLQATMDRLNRDLLSPRGLNLAQVYDETEYIDAAIGLAEDDMYLAAVLTIATLLVFLKSVRPTIVICLTIPSCVVGTFLVMWMFNRTLNVVSLAGLAFAIGIVVDNATVVLENIYRHWQQGKSARDASVDGTVEVWGAVLASTLTNVSVFLPILFIKDQAGQLFGDIALAISAATLLSLVAAMTLIPAAAAIILQGRRVSADVLAGFAVDERELRHRVHPPHVVRHDGNGVAEAGQNGNGAPLVPVTTTARPPSRSGPRWRQFLLAVIRPFDALGHAFVEWIVATNRMLMATTWRRLATVVGFVGASTLLTYYFWPAVEYLPQGNRNLTIGIMLPPPGYNMDEMMEMGVRVEEALRPYWDVDPQDPDYQNLPYPAVEDFFFVVRSRNVFMGVRAIDPQRAGELKAPIQALAAELPGTIINSQQSSLFEQGLAAGRTVDIEITGRDLPKLVEIGGEVLNRARQVMPEGTQMRPKPSLDLANPELHVIPKPEQAADMQVRTEEIGYLVNALVDGAYAGDYYLGGDKIDLTIKGDQHFVRRTQDVENLPVAMLGDQLVPLAAVADVKIGVGPEQIAHRERDRAITIAVSPPQTLAIEAAMQKVQDEIIAPLRAEGKIPDSVRINLAGTADKLRATWRSLRGNFLLALLITYLLMAALFESWLYPLVIILTVPLGTVGGVLGLWLLNLFVVQNLDVITMLGFVILVGTVVNNPILIVHQSLNHMRHGGMAMREAILESVRNRTRPIFITTLTTVLGLLPLVLMPGAGSELYRGLGAVVLGGLSLSTCITLILVPAIFSLTMDGKNTVQPIVRRALGWDVSDEASTAAPVAPAALPAPHRVPADPHPERRPRSEPETSPAV